MLEYYLYRSKLRKDTQKFASYLYTNIFYYKKNIKIFVCSSKSYYCTKTINDQCFSRIEINHCSLDKKYEQRSNNRIVTIILIQIF